MCLMHVRSTFGCVPPPYVTLNTTSFADWEKKIDGQQIATSARFGIGDKASSCYSINPCIVLSGDDPNNEHEDIYIERTFDSSLWSNVTFVIDYYIGGLDNPNEYGFFETECNGNIANGNVERDTFQHGVNGQYSGCFNRTTQCNELIIRIGGNLDGPRDWLWITQVVYMSTPSPISLCVAAPHILDTTSFVGWEKKIDGTIATSTNGFSIYNDPSSCYGINPCFRINGIEPNTANENVYIERTLDSSLWSDVNFGIDFTVQWLDDIDEYGFFETECNGNIERNTFLRGQNAKVHHVECFYRQTPCDELIIRIGANLDGSQDYLWISQIVYQSSKEPTSLSISTPTQYPSIRQNIPIDPTTVETAVKVVKYSFSFEVDQPVTEDEMEQIVLNALVAYPNVHIESTVIKNEGDVLMIISSNDTRLTEDIIEAEVEEELEQEYDQDIEVTVTKVSTDSNEDETTADIFKDEMMIIILTLSLLLLLAGIIIIILWRRNDQRQNKTKETHANMAMEVGSTNHVIQATDDINACHNEKAAPNPSEIAAAAVAVNGVAVQEAILSDLYDEMMYTDDEDSVFGKQDTSGGGQDKTVEAPEATSGTIHCGDDV